MPVPGKPLWPALAAGTESRPKGRATIFEPHHVFRMYPPCKPASRPVESVRNSTARVVSFRARRAFLPDSESLGDGLPLILEQKIKIFQVRAFDHDMGKPLFDQQSVDHVTLLKEYIGKESTVLIPFFPVKLQSYPILPDQAGIKGL